jgi:hypothetical protein
MFKCHAAKHYFSPLHPDGHKQASFNHQSLRYPEALNPFSGYATGMASTLGNYSDYKRVIMVFLFLLALNKKCY